MLMYKIEFYDKLEEEENALKIKKREKLNENTDTLNNLML